MGKSRASTTTQTDYIFDRCTVDDIQKSADDYAQVLARHGVLHVKGALRQQAPLTSYIGEVKQLTCSLLHKLGKPADPSQAIDKLLTDLHHADPAYPRYIHGLCSNPSKLVSSSLLKHHPIILSILQAHFGPEALIGTPSKSDLISFFFADKSFIEYDLPIHQDFHYMMQSPRQVVVWIPLSQRVKDVGGLHCWQGSHTSGVKPVRAQSFQYEVDASDEELAKYPRVELDWEFGDIVFMDSLLWHRTIPNTTQQDTRVVQIYRFSDLNNTAAEDFLWRSTDYVDQATEHRKSVKFEDIYPDLYKA